MKISIFTFIFFQFLSNNIFAQKIMNEGTLVYSISIETTNGEKQINSALNGAVLSLFYTKDKSRTEMQTKIGTEATVYDNKADKGFILKEYSGQKLMITTTADNWELKNHVNRNLVFKIDETKTMIEGYNCYKATATSADGKNYTVFYDATKIIANKTYNNAFPQIEGVPVQYEMQSGNLVFKYTLNKIENEVLPANKFDAPKIGFRVMTYEEANQLK
ncbi:MAG: hypothetical protein ABL929_08645, partial [Ferruginibacter sp.]